MPVVSYEWGTYAVRIFRSRHWATAQDVSYIRLEPRLGHFEGRSMQRPAMDPTFTFDAPAPPSAKRKRMTTLQRLRALVWLMLRLLARLLLLSPFGRKPNFRNEEGTCIGRFVRGL